LLQSSERLLLFNHYVNYCQTSILHLQTEMANLVHELANFPSPIYLENVLGVMKHVEHQWEGELAWVVGLRAHELAQHGLTAETSSQPEQ
jgi:hypothetical protein